jgi:O-antigen/teichoic acid export membrane protein
MLVGIVSLCFLGATIIWLLYKENSDEQLFLQTLFWGGLLIPLVALSNLRGATLRGLEYVVRGQLPELIFRPGIFLILLISIIWLTNIHLNAHSAMALHVIATAIAFLIGVMMLFKAMPPQCSKVKPITEPKKWLTSAFPMALNEGMRFLQGHISILLLGWLATQADVGLFRVAVQIGLLVEIPVSLINVVIAPYISRFYAEKNFLQLKKMIAYAALAMFLSVLLLFVFFILFGKYFLAISFGVEFKEAYYTLIIICSGQLINAFFGLSVMLLTMTHHERAVMRAFLVSLISSSFLAWGIVPLYGILGAAIASTVGIFIWNIMLWKYALRVLDINTSILSIINHNNIFKIILCII